MKDIRNVGVIGLGKMGMPMARLLRERGFTVTGYDVALAVVKTAAGNGIQPVNSPKAVAAASDLTIIAVGFDSEVEAVMFGDNGALAGATDDSVIAIASTVAPSLCASSPSVAPAGLLYRCSPFHCAAANRRL